MLMEYVGMFFRDFLEKFNCIIYYVEKFVIHTFSEMILLRGELGRITFDVGSRVQKYISTSPPPPPI